MTGHGDYEDVARGGIRLEDTRSLPAVDAVHEKWSSG
jgi:hypothetical protein